MKNFKSLKKIKNINEVFKFGDLLGEGAFG